MTVLCCTQYSSIFINIHQYSSIFINIYQYSTFCTFCRFSKVVAPAHLVALLGWVTRQIVSCLSGSAQDAQLAMKRVWKESLSACLPRKHRENEWKLCSTPLEYLYYWSLVLSIGFPPKQNQEPGRHPPQVARKEVQGVSQHPAGSLSGSRRERFLKKTSWSRESPMKKCDTVKHPIWVNIKDMENSKKMEGIKTVPKNNTIMGM